MPMFEALAERKRAEVLDIRFDALLVWSAVVNLAGGHEGKAVCPYDFMPDDYRPKSETDFDETPEQFQKRTAAWNAAMLEAQAVNHLLKQQRPN